jgi:hypothetical protein
LWKALHERTPLNGRNCVAFHRSNGDSCKASVLIAANTSAGLNQ